MGTVQHLPADIIPHLKALRLIFDPELLRLEVHGNTAYICVRHTNPRPRAQIEALANCITSLRARDIPHEPLLYRREDRVHEPDAVKVFLPAVF